MTKVKDISQCKHPCSRKTRALQRQIKKATTKEKKKIHGSIKQNLIGEKLLWFQEHLQQVELLTPDHAEELIHMYLGRFNEELEQISIKHSIGNRKNRQHASREDIIKLTIKREEEEFRTCGIEIPDLLNQDQLNLLRTWNGELRYLPNFKLKRYSHNFFETRKTK
ncbi:translation machinery-associated protein 16 homolog [Coccinella septempunctata]|uniref:translation machinery-associated protein 16 homolog n=1 Tax=Coccinella septempunctata TaxID=41139 RepID=UPI001D08AEDA|nr:translation machinery-associated protein 16 homolog [Coccinella septempunctata]